MPEIILTSTIQQDDYTNQIGKLFGLNVSDQSVTKIINNIQPPAEWNIAAIVGSNGSGKSTLLKTFGEILDFKWDYNKAVISNFPKHQAEEIFEAFCAAGFASIPSWLRPYRNLSEGEQFRADLAAKFLLTPANQIILVDEFASKNDRIVAQSASFSAAKFLRKYNRKCIFVSCHFDVLPWLAPDWYYNPAEGVTQIGSDSLQRPEISLEIIRCSQTAWSLFQQYHYLNQNLSRGARCFLALWNDKPVAFAACLAMPNANLGYAWRGSRVVALPDYQGLNIGVKLSDHIASMAKATGCKYYAKSVHPAMVAYRRRSPNWRETKASGKVKKQAGQSMIERGWSLTPWRCASFQYIGPASTEEAAKLFWDDSVYCQPKKKRAIQRGLIEKGQGRYYTGSKRTYSKENKNKLQKINE